MMRTITIYTLYLIFFLLLLLLFFFFYFDGLGSLACSHSELILKL
jgi:hypothetical protein